MKSIQTIKNILDEALEKYHNWDFVTHDPIQIPHTFSIKQDIEISAFFAALFALGKRSVVIQKTRHLMELMDNTPYQFIQYYCNKDLVAFKKFKHRFFKFEDILFLFQFLKNHYQSSNSLETAFLNSNPSILIEQSLHCFYQNVLKTPHKKRSEKHISSPLNHSACKRMTLFLRWMIRQDKKNIDFGLWQFVSPSQLIIPVDTHVLRVCREQLKITTSSQANWKTALEITTYLKQLNPQDPTIYDFALMGIGLNNMILPRYL